MAPFIDSSSIDLPTLAIFIGIFLGTGTPKTILKFTSKTYSMFLDCILMSQLKFHHFKYDPMPRIRIAFMNKATPSNEDDHQQNNDGNKHYKESSIGCRAFFFRATPSILITTKLAVSCAC
jgi:hypothetical protein